MLEIFGAKNRMTKKALYLLQKICGPEQREHHSRRESKSLRIFCQKKERPQDLQTNIEKEEKKEGEMLHSGSFRFMILPRFGSKTTNFHLYV